MLTASEQLRELLQYVPGRAPLPTLRMQPVRDGAQALYYFQASRRTVKKSLIRNH